MKSELTAFFYAFIVLWWGGLLLIGCAWAAHRKARKYLQERRNQRLLREWASHV